MNTFFECIYNRVFWTIILLSSIVGMAYIFISTYNRYSKDSVNINLDTAYIHWTNTFPAVSACVARNSKMDQIKTFVKAYLLATNQTLPKKCVTIGYTILYIVTFSLAFHL